MIGGTLLRRIKRRKRFKKRVWRRPTLNVAQILTWAEAHYARYGRWPKANSGRIVDAPENTWCGVDSSLRDGFRGLPCGLSLAQLLWGARGVRNLLQPPRLARRRRAFF